MYLKGWELATLTFDMYKIAHTLLGRSCILYFETVLGMNKITPTPSPLNKNIKIFQQIFFICNNILRKFIKGK